jgi:esterase/lipase superfamily enzyme
VTATTSSPPTFAWIPADSWAFGIRIWIAVVITMKVESFGDLFDGYYDDTIYFHTPTHFLPGLTCAWRLENLRRMDIVLTVRKADPFLDNNRRLSRLLDERSVRHQLHLCEGRAHCPRAWREMAPLYV